MVVNDDGGRSDSSKNKTSWASRHAMLARVLETAVSTFVWWASEKYLPVAFRKLGGLFTKNTDGKDDSKDDHLPLALLGARGRRLTPGPEGQSGES